VAESSDLIAIEWLGRLGPKLLERRPQIERWAPVLRGGPGFVAGKRRSWARLDR
jgi:hypothetical protein